MVESKSIAGIRREYGAVGLSEETLSPSPIDQFERWLAEVVRIEKQDPTAMVLSTVDKLGHPDSRVVLLKEIKDGAFLFYTHYESAKATQMQKMPYVALNFYWPKMARQVTLRGQVERTSSEQSDLYFSSRPRESQLSAIASAQSHEIRDRDALLADLQKTVSCYKNKPIVRPAYWGGYAVIPYEVEFWQGRDHRLHDRILYERQGDHWLRHRLAP